MRVDAERPISPLAWHAQGAAAVVEIFGTTVSGLSDAEALLRFNAYGPNELRAAREGSPWRALAAQRVVQEYRAAIVYTTCLQRAFGTFALSGADWTLVVAIASPWCRCSTS